MNATYFLKKLWMHAPLSWAIIRASECELISQQTFQSPVLEVGCGDGLVTSILFNSKKEAIDLGMDLDAEELRRAKKSGAYKKLVLEDICHADIHSNSFNTIFSNGVLEHIPDLPKALNEISRVLKKKGKLITTSPLDSYTNLLFYYQLFTALKLTKLAQKYGEFINKKFAHRHLLSLKRWKKLFENAGLELVDFKYCNNSKTTMLHDLCLPFSLGSKTFKAKTDSLALFPSIRSLLQKPIIPLLYSFTKEGVEDVKIYSTILLVAKKR